MPKNDGGPAFPIRCSGGIGTDETYHYAGGMSLRDWFAGQALKGLMALWLPGSVWKDATRDAFMIADEMLVARVSEVNKITPPERKGTK